MRAHRSILLAAAAIFLAGCGDTLTGPEASASAHAPTVLMNSTGGETGNAVHGLDAPLVVFDVLDDQVELCATWTDFSMFEPEDPHVYSFDVELLEEGEWAKLGTAGGQGSAHEDVCFVTDPMDPGTYDFRVKGMANVPTGGIPPYSPHHTGYTQVEVTVGETLRFEVLIRNNGGEDFGNELTFNFRGGNWNFQLMLQVWDGEAFVPVASCEAYPWDDMVSSVGWDEDAPADAQDDLTLRDPCEDDSGLAIYKVQLENPTPNPGAESRQGTIQMLIDGIVNENEVTFESN